MMKFQSGSTCIALNISKAFWPKIESGEIGSPCSVVNVAYIFVANVLSKLHI
jgi:hypothetical protein